MENRRREDRLSLKKIIPINNNKNVLTISVHEDERLKKLSLCKQIPMKYQKIDRKAK